MEQIQGPKTEPKRMKWIYLTEFTSDVACGMRTWYRDFRADIKLKDGVYEYWLSECFKSDHDVYWTKSRQEPDVFKAMQQAEVWLKEYADAHWSEGDEEGSDE